MLQKPRNKQAAVRGKKSRFSRFLVTGKNGFMGKRLIRGRAFSGRTEDFDSLMQQSKKVNGIVHLAAVSNKRLAEEDPQKCISSNLIGLCNVLEVARKQGLWVLFVSTYQRLEPHLYGLTKLTGEELCRIYQRRGVKVKILRFPVVYGPGDRKGKIVMKFIRELKDGKDPQINTDEKFHFLYVKDAAALIEKEVEIMNIRFGKAYTLYELRDGIKECLNE